MRGTSLARPLRLGLRGRLALGIGLVSVVLGVVAGNVFLRAILEAAYDAERERSVHQLRSLAPGCARAIATMRAEQLDDMLSEVVLADESRLGRVRFMEAYDARGQLLARAVSQAVPPEHPFDVVDPAFLDSARQTDDGLWRLVGSEGDALQVALPASSGLRWGTLVAGFDVSGLQRRATGISRLVAVLAVLGSALLFLVVWAFISRQVLQPVWQLSQAAERIRSGDLGSRAGLERGDELGRLAATFDEMASELESNTRDLEQRVARRSARIREQNEDLERMNQRLAAINQQLEHLAITDPLTGLHNRRHFENSLEFELQRGLRAGHEFCLLILDLDHFKRVNDSWGHPVGDRVLCAVAALLQGGLRATDICARYGGEEFVVLMLDTARSSGVDTAEKIRGWVGEYGFTDLEGDPLGPITVSIGLACFPADGTQAEALVGRADEALYRAKEQGRDRVEVAGG